MKYAFVLLSLFICLVGLSAQTMPEGELFFNTGSKQVVFCVANSTDSYVVNYDQVRKAADYTLYVFQGVVVAKQCDDSRASEFDKFWYSFMASGYEQCQDSDEICALRWNQKASASAQGK